MEEKETLKREERDTYLITYVDPYAKNVLRWADLTEQEQKDIKDYRRYLLDFTEQKNWWEENVLTFEEWKFSSAATFNVIEREVDEDAMRKEKEVI